MAQAFPQSLSSISTRFGQLSNQRKIGIMVAIAAVFALVIGVLMWSQTPSQKVLFSNLSDKDSGAVIASLEQMNIPYTIDSGNVIKVPEDQVYNVRLRLATQGLPKSGPAGFELLDNQRLGVSQFAEQVSYQRAIEGELARSIESIDAVESARVHLAFPKSTVFVREQQKPSASVLLNVRGGRILDDAQIAGVMHLVASSVPDLPVQNVTIVDQKGNLLSNDANSTGRNPGLDAKQLEYVHQVELSYTKRIEDILAAVWGKDNVKAQVTAQLDFAQTEQTSETYKPNPTPADATVRSQQTVETQGDNANGASGVPGALSNQPPGAATAPLVAQNQPGTTTASTAATNPNLKHRETTVNYEVDKTISHTLLPTGVVRRLSVAVVLNYKPKVTNGQSTYVPLTSAEVGQAENLVREAMGFNTQRGDTLNLVNAQFADSMPLVTPSMMEKITTVASTNWLDIARYTVVGLIVFYLFFGVLRPIMRDLTGASKRFEPQLAGAGGAAAGAATGEPGAAGEMVVGDDGVLVSVSEHQQSADELRQKAENEARLATYTENLATIKQMAKEDPRVVATIIREWMLKEESA
ncbi:flagellar M-ring protein FliF [Leeia sp. TBRC 13508]|uniref:Flagellar M-ring protein n=1 Tax=Leeia speluncae TaxID=2884804 RepID=A0ABS8D2K9_9NEIS|nr:flagellar basal-body MS-ring/collar protein FliF [Leeia speluncae]MCB6182421.1 flagellar M-ring protein FliF [Leeia speluncae]